MSLVGTRPILPDELEQYELHHRASKDELMEVYEVMKKNQYGQYLKDVMDGKYQEHLY